MGLMSTGWYPVLWATFSSPFSFTPSLLLCILFRRLPAHLISLPPPPRTCSWFSRERVDCGGEEVEDARQTDASRADAENRHFYFPSSIYLPPYRTHVLVAFILFSFLFFSSFFSPHEDHVFHFRYWVGEAGREFNRRVFVFFSFHFSV